MRVALVQHDIVWEDRDATLARLRAPIAAAAGSGARLVVLTETFATGFSMATDRLAEPLDGPTTGWMRERAAEHDAWIAGSVMLAGGPDGRATNSLLLVGPDGRLQRYDKRHPFTYAGEHEHFAAGTDPVVGDVDGVRLGLSVCYDLRFMDAFWTQATQVDAYLVVANWPAARQEHWRALLVARAIENQAYVVGVNRVGRGDGVDYAGGSMVVAPDGVVLVSAGPVEAVLDTEIDPTVVTAVRSAYPFLRDRT